MTIATTALISVVVGWFGHSLAMRVRFKEKSVEYKVKVFDSLLGYWVQMRNLIYRNHPVMTGQPVTREIVREFDQVYGRSQQAIGEALLVCRDRLLNKRINDMNERMYRTLWLEFEREAIDIAMEEFKDDAFALVMDMRADIESETHLSAHDLAHVFSFKR